MIQRSLFDYYKSTKAPGSENTVKKKLEVTPKQRNRRKSSAITKQERRQILQDSPGQSSTSSSSSSSASSTTPMKSSQPPKYVITLTDSDEDMPPDSQLPLPTTSKHSNSNSWRQKDSSFLSDITSPGQPSPRILSQSTSQEKNSPGKTAFRVKIPSKKASNSDISSESSSPKRFLSLSPSKNVEKRKKFNEILSQLSSKEDSFQGYPLSSSTSHIESREVPDILHREVQKEISFADKSMSFIKEELMLSDDDWEDVREIPTNSSSAAKAVVPTPEKTSPKYLRILPVASINSKFDSQQNSRNNAPNTHPEISNFETPKKKESPEKYSNTENCAKRNLSFLQKEENFLDDFTDILDDEEIDCPQTPKKSNTSSTNIFKTPEKKTDNGKLGMKHPRILENSPTSSKSPRTPNKRSPNNYSPLKKSPRARRIFSPRKIFKENINYETVVENLNLAKQGAIPMNEFDLEKIYESGEFEFKWGKMDTSVAVMYESSDVVLPMNSHSERLLEMIYWVFSEPMNCGYFNAEERDTVFNIMTLEKEEQVLLARMLKREIKWFRVRKQKYEDHIGGNQEQHYMELANKGFFDSNYDNVDIEIILNLLQVDELKQLCKMMKKNHTVTKPKLIASLKQMFRERTGLFGSKSPRDILKSNLVEVAGPILKLSTNVLTLLHRILVLYYPNHDPEDQLSSVFHLFNDVHFGNKIFPTTPIMRFPIFKNRQALIDYVEAKLAWMKIIQVTNETNKDDLQWEIARDCGTKAYEGLKSFINLKLNCDDEKTSSDQKQMTSKLPSHIGRFSAIYVWSKVLILSIDAFKKLKADGYLTAKTYLEFLINNRDKIPVNFGKLYKELTLIEMSHLKNLERSAELTLEAFSIVKSPIDQAEMIDRARKLQGRSKGLSQTTKAKLKEIVDQMEEHLLCIPKIESIEVTKVDKEGRGKSLWQLDIGDEEKGYGNVENVSLNHYAQCGYPKGIHCEGSLPVTLFACLFWEEIYHISVPGAFISQFQREPLDLFGMNFYENRKEIILKKLAFLENVQDTEVIADIMAQNYSMYSSLETIICKIVEDADLLKEIIICLGKNAVLGICKKIIFGGYINWRSGFPDLFVWNDKTKKCKVVEVKGPGDTLSVKQKLWIRYLEEIHVNVEVCLVKAKQKY